MQKFFAKLAQFFAVHPSQAQSNSPVGVMLFRLWPLHNFEIIIIAFRVFFLILVKFFLNKARFIWWLAQRLPQRNILFKRKTTF